MCGLVGMAGDISNNARNKIFRDMLDVCQVRGRDSTGVIKVNKKAEDGYDFAKAVGAPNLLYESRAYEINIETGPLPAALIGHTRSKTSGEISRKHAHPFDFPDEGVIGVHNGTLSGYYKLDTYHHSKVDSEVLYGHLALNGPDDTFDAEIGAYACVWWDDKKRTLNFIRNSERPLLFTWSEDGRTLFWASEIWMFGAVGRQQKLWDGDGKPENKVFELPVNTHWAFTLDADAAKDKPTVTQVVNKKITVKPATAYTSTAWNQQGGGRFQQRGIWDGINDNLDDDLPWANDWVQNSKREWVRAGSEEDDTEKTKASILVVPPAGKKGGEVTNPFLPVIQHQNANLPTLVNRNVDRTESPTMDVTKTSSLSSLGFMQPVRNTGDRRTERSSTSGRMKRSILGLAKSSPNSRLSNSDESSSGCEKHSALLNRGGSSRKKQNPQGVSLRNVAGLTYVTNTFSGEEYLWEFLLDTSQGTCTFCKSKVVEPLQIGAILGSKDEAKILCTDCLNEPSATSYAEAC